MLITPLTATGNSSKFTASTKKGEFVIALSHTLRTKIWKLPDSEAELTAAQELAEAIVSRHDPALPFKKIYIFAEHNSDITVESTVQCVRKQGKDS